MKRRARPPRPIPAPLGPRLVSGALNPAWHRPIWEAYKAGYTQREIAHAFGVHRATVEKSINSRRAM